MKRQDITILVSILFLNMLLIITSKDDNVVLQAVLAAVIVGLGVYWIRRSNRLEK